MKLKTIDSSKLYEWHNHFLWIPKKVRVCENRDNATLKWIMWWTEFRYELLWLETVQRKNNSLQSFDLDDRKYNYWKKL